MKRIGSIILLGCAFGFICARGAYAQDDGVYSQYAKEDAACRSLLKSQNVKEAEAHCMADARLAARLGSGRELEKMSAYEYVGHVMMGEGRYQEALNYYSRALDVVRTRLTDRNAEVGQLYWDIATAHHALHSLDKALEFYRKAEKTYQVAYAAINPDEVTVEGLEIKRSYLRALRKILEAHILAADQASASSEADEIRKQLKSLDSSNSIS